MADNTLWIVQGHDHRWLQSLHLTAQQPSWVAGCAPLPQSLAAKTRYRQADAGCVLTEISDLGFSLDFANAQWAVTPGQSAVLYNAEVCLGGGVIETKN
jgi:tRNA-specific 2-thiouridylase